MEDDQDELLQCSDEESLSETEDNCLPSDKPPSIYNHATYLTNHTKFEFILTKILLILSTTAILIILPLYIDTINISGDVYSLMLTNTFISTIVLFIICVIMRFSYTKFRQIKFFVIPMEFPRFAILTIMYTISGMLIVYSLDRKRVLCHLQDPIKGIVLVFSLLYYFFFCRKFMGLQRIFSATTIIVGLFIAVDYGLCDEFKCRGYERKQIVDDAGSWNWSTHSAWTTIYIIGLALFAAYFNLFERFLLMSNQNSQPQQTSTTLLSTVSRSVSYPSTNNLLSTTRSQETVHLNREYSTLHISVWLQVFHFILTVALFGTDLLPNVGKVSVCLLKGQVVTSAIRREANDFNDFLNNTGNGFFCHFLPPVSDEITSKCGNLFVINWLFLIGGISYTLTSIRFLILTQSSIYTIATMTASLPILGIWWSLFYISPNGALVWSPSITGELICSLLGFPIILIGLILLCKAHFKDLLNENSIVLSSNNLT